MCKRPRCEKGMMRQGTMCQCRGSWLDRSSVVTALGISDWGDIALLPCTCGRPLHNVFVLTRTIAGTVGISTPEQAGGSPSMYVAESPVGHAPDC